MINVAHWTLATHLSASCLDTDRRARDLDLSRCILHTLRGRRATMLLADGVSRHALQISLYLL